jgi:uncharacterized damage-inducible protein DinB
MNNPKPIERQTWFAREFPTGLPPQMLPVIIERLRGTPCRIRDRLDGLNARLFTLRAGDTWSIQENVGHLLDLEPLWIVRLEDLAAGRSVLSAADLQNRRTHEANYNAHSFDAIQTAFRAARGECVRRLEMLGEDDARRSAEHPRLRRPMNAVDLAHFVAEHDDYHLARISELLRTV